MSHSSLPENATGITCDCLEAVPLKRPTRDDWECHRPLIKRLYVDESQKLSEVVAIMKQYGHIATPKMYKDRFKKWGFDRKNKERDMVAILRKQTQRDAVGKESIFRVRGRQVAIDDVLNYFKRKKGMQEMGTSTATTPSDVSCRTPSPSLEYMTQTVDSGIRVGPDSSRPYRDLLPFSPCGEIDAGAGVSGSRGTITLPFVADQYTTRSAVSDIYTFLSEDTRIPRSPSPPLALLIPELLLVRIKSYFEGSFESEIWITDEPGYITSAAATGTAKPANFQAYVRTAPQLVQMGSLIEFRRVLSKAFDLIQGMLREEHPLTLFAILLSIVELLRQGRPEIVSMLLSYIKEMVMSIIARGNPWGDIWRLIGMLDIESFEQAIIQCCQCTYSTIKHGLGSFHPSTIDILIPLNQNTLSVVEEEQMLRETIAQSEYTSGVVISSQLALLQGLAINLRGQQEYLKAEELGQQILGRAESPETRVYALEHIAWMQFYQNKTEQAEKTMRNVIELIVNQWGVTDPWVISYTVCLEQWLRIWGRDEDADKWKADREILIGKYEID